MGSDWTWELRVPVAGEIALREAYALAAERDLRPRRPDGLINLFGPDAESRQVDDPRVAVAAMATGGGHGQFWTGEDVDVFVSWDDGVLTWSLDSVFRPRRPGPGADGFREVHARLTDLWLTAAQRLGAGVGRVLDEWSSEQVWHLAGGDWPAELGWLTYLGPGGDLRTPLPPDVAARTRRLDGGALLVTLLDDPAAVDALRYEDIHREWLGV
ncbi:hypothetical protein [Actinoplanes sp. NPDC051494]|uniref:hypothetical protein n=1 Tax=Actinoplanes sp. NPDC051494 TaxID=3363907 RepID=UPI0037BB5334